MLTKAKLAVGTIGLAAGIGLVGGIWLHGNIHGKRTVESQYQAALVREQVRQRDLAAQLEEARRARQRVITETIEVIRHVPDPTGCADAPIDPGILDRLR